MHWIAQWMQRRNQPQDVARGEYYFSSGRIINQVDVLIGGGRREIHALVQGGNRYHVEVLLNDKMEIIEDCSCDCPRFEDREFCKHVAAVLFKEIDQQKPRYTDGSRMLQSYLDRASLVAEEAPVHLEPRLGSIQGGYPNIELMIGREKLYVVKNIQELAQRVANGSTVSYGKKLTICHRIENFDESSQQLLRLILNEYPAFSAIGTPHWRDFYQGTTDIRQIRFTGMEFDCFFDIYRGLPIYWHLHNQKVIPQDGDPDIVFSLKQVENGAVLDLKINGTEFFGRRDALYAIQGDRLLRCSHTFTEEIYPLIDHRYPLFFNRELLPTLSVEILSKLVEHTCFQDPDGILAQYQPEPCTPCYYFDWDAEEGLTGQLRFRYGDKVLTSENAGQINRDFGAENRASQFGQRFLEEDPVFSSLSEDDKVMSFLTEMIFKFQEVGEVYLSDSLKRRQIRPKQLPTAGISVSDGILSLDLDTGEFPLEELEALYGSLLRKKKYHRLADGRFLALDGSGYETLAQAAHMLQLTSKDLQKGSVTMPAFRGLYLQELLGNQNEVVLRRDARYRQMIRDFKTVEDSDYPIPAEMETVLRPYQATGFRWLKTLERNGFCGLLADEMGLGKTIQIIAYLLTVPKVQTGKTSLVVCPASLILNWGEELQRFAPSLNIQLIMGNTKERKQQRSQGEQADVWVTSYDLLKRDVEDYGKLAFYACILDEGQNIKNQSTQASKAVKQIDSQIRFVLTGTPIENRLSELWNLFDFLMPGYLFSHNAFVTKLEKPIAKSGNTDAMGQLRRLVQPFILRRIKKEVLRELPDKQEFTRKILLSQEERKVYQASANAALQRAATGADKMKILALLTQLRQLCCDPNLCFENYQGQTSKLEACLELCEAMAANGHQILLFSQFTSMLERIRGRLDDMGITNQTLTGATPKEKRAELVKTFQAGSVSVFMISLKAGGTGLNLTNADVVIHYDPWWNLSTQNQATDRAHRIGQKNCVQVYKLIAQGTLEEKILSLQEKKAALTDVLSGDDLLEPLSREELLELMQE